MKTPNALQELPKGSYLRLLPLLEKVDFNSLFALSVIKGHVEGTIFVDDLDAPKNTYIIHSYGISLLILDTETSKERISDFKESLYSYLLEERSHPSTQRCYGDEWMLVYPIAYGKQIETALRDRLEHSIQESNLERLELFTRVNFTFDLKTFREFRSQYTPPRIQVTSVGKEAFKKIQGHVIPSSFWKSAEDFVDKGVAFSVIDDKEYASTAFAVFIHGKYLEIGIETQKRYQGQGYARAVAVKIIEYCLEHDYTPVWGCSYENTASYKLAVSLGFIPLMELPYCKILKLPEL